MVMMRNAKLLPLVAALVGTGCVPGQVTQTSGLTGTLLRNAQPVSGAELTYEVVRPLQATPVEATFRTTTDAHGRFEVPRTEEWGWKGPLAGVGHCYRGWRIIFAESDGSQTEFTTQIYGPCRAPEQIVATCDVAKAPPDVCLIESPEWLAEYGRPF